MVGMVAWVHTHPHILASEQWETACMATQAPCMVVPTEESWGTEGTIHSADTEWVIQMILIV